RVLAEAAGRWPLQGAVAIHRHGLIRPGEGIVLVLAASAHRSAAFEAASFLMDYLKTRAPFWKREHHTDGTLGGWVEAMEHDAAAAARW
ncbi:molybdenum cofactor biosynthesis protein MoaE, partial [Methylobacterium aquaticum]